MDKEKGNDAYEIPDEEGDRFDRSYTLDELLPLSHAVSFLNDLHEIGLDFIGIFLPDGGIYFSTDNNWAESLSQSVLSNEDVSMDGPQRIRENVLVMPMVHHFETLGFLVVECNSDPSQFQKKQEALVVFISKILDQVIGGNFKHLMTSGLHKQVVKESYEEIRLKNELLEKSEKKYRLLAENLEKEVFRISEEVKEAHTQMMHQEKLASIGHLAAGVAHEINNPMGFISSNLRTLKDYTLDLNKALKVYNDLCDDIESLFRSAVLDSESREKLKTRMEDIRKLDVEYILNDIPQLLEESMEGAERINKIVSDLKDFAHPGEEQPSHADLIECIESTLRIVWNELKYKTTVIRSYQKIPEIYCFPRQLNQVIMNLLVNAAQAIEKNGDIEIMTRDLGDHVEMIIRDTGHGIPEDIQPRIFNPFFTTKEVGKGTGLGLNLVYNIIKKHQGEIHVKSEVGKGTSFIIKLPVSAEL